LLGFGILQLMWMSLMGVIVFSFVFLERLLVDVLLGDDCVAKHSFDEWHQA
jgi:hypothetical protein